MKKVLSSFSRGPGLAIFALLVFAVVSFVLFTTVGQPSATPSAATTPTRTSNPYPAPATPISVFSVTVPTPYVPPTQAPLPTTYVYPKLSLTPTPARTSTPELTAFPPTVTSWARFQGVKTGFSFLYPAGWSITENSTIAPAFSPNPQVTIYIVNYDLTKAEARGGLPPGALKIDIRSNEFSVPPGGTPFTVGPQQFPGRQFVSDRSNSADLLPSLERMILIHFTAVNRQWLISGGFGPPKDVADKNTQIFYQIVGSLRYESK